MAAGAKKVFLFLCRSVGLFRISRWLTRHKLRILGYHGFALADECRWRAPLFISEQTFRRRLAYLKRYGFNVLPLREAMKGLDCGQLPELPTVVTIDDGFAGVYLKAAKPLKDACIPATLYVTTYYVVHPVPVYRLAVSYMFWKTSCSEIDLDRLSIGMTGRVRLTDAKQVKQTAWDITLFGEQSCSEEQRAAILDRLGDALRVSYAEIARSRMLSLATEIELRELVASGMDIQLHTHRHRLPEDPEEIERELTDNREILGRIVGGPLRDFCYPDGARSERHWPALEKAGIATAVTCVSGLCDAASPRLGLPRLLDGEDLSQIEFEAMISGFTLLLRSLRNRLAGARTVAF